MLWLPVGLAVTAWAAAPVADARDDAVVTAASAADARAYDIPAQPLEAALKRYAILSDRPTLFPSVMVAGRISSAVHGEFLPEEVLTRLLAGTGLVAEKIHTGAGDAFILKELAASDTAVPARASPVAGVNFDYGARVQARVRAALCADARTASHDYRALLRFDIDASGQVQQPGLLTSSGDRLRDTAVLAALRRVNVGRAPPPGMAQPLTMIILPEDGGDAAQRCANRNMQAGRP